MSPPHFILVWRRSLGGTGGESVTSQQLFLEPEWALSQ